MDYFSDTDPKIQRKVYDKLRSMSPEERLRRLNNLCVTGRSMMINGIKASNPSISEPELLREYAKRLLGPHFSKLSHYFDTKT